MKIKLSPKIKICLIGLATGIVNGLFGAGAGLLCIPALKGIMKTEEKTAHATTIFAVFFATLVSLLVYFKNDQISVASTFPYMIGGVIGAPIGALLLGKIKTKLLNILFALFLIYSAIRMMINV